MRREQSINETCLRHSIKPHHKTGQTRTSRAHENADAQRRIHWTISVPLAAKVFWHRQQRRKRNGPIDRLLPRCSKRRNVGRAPANLAYFTLTDRRTPAQSIKELLFSTAYKSIQPPHRGQNEVEWRNGIIASSSAMQIFRIGI